MSHAIAGTHLSDAAALQAVTSAVIFAIADAISQLLGSAARFSLFRCAMAGMWGLVWGGPSAHVWQGFMEQLSTQRDIRTVLGKVRHRRFWHTFFTALAMCIPAALRSDRVVTRKRIVHIFRVARNDLTVNSWLLHSVTQSKSYMSCLLALLCKLHFLTCVITKGAALHNRHFQRALRTGKCDLRLLQSWHVQQQRPSASRTVNKRPAGMMWLLLCRSRLTSSHTDRSTT